jgi:hypothetical protein
MNDLDSDERSWYRAVASLYGRAVAVSPIVKRLALLSVIGVFVLSVSAILVRQHLGLRQIQAELARLNTVAARVAAMYPVQPASVAKPSELPSLGLLLDWSLERDPRADAATYLRIQTEAPAPPIAVTKREMKALLHALLGGRRELHADRFGVVPVRDGQERADILLDRYMGNAWKFESGRFVKIEVEDILEMRKVSTEWGELIDIVVDRTSGYVIKRTTLPQVARP